MDIEKCPVCVVVKCSLKTSKGIANQTVEVAALPNHLAEHQIPHVPRPEHNLGMLSRLVLATDLRKTTNTHDWEWLLPTTKGDLGDSLLSYPQYCF